MIKCAVVEKPEVVDGRWNLITYLDTDVKVGDVFDAVSVMQVADSPGPNDPEGTITQVLPLQLRIEEIYYFNHSFLQANKGMGCRLVVAGDVKNLLESWRLKRAGIGIGLEGK